MKKFLYTTAYILSDQDINNKFGYVQGFAYLPDYEIKIKIYINNTKFEDQSDIDNTKALTLNQSELQCIIKATNYIENSLQTLISLSRIGNLKEEAYGTSEEQHEF